MAICCPVRTRKQVKSEKVWQLLLDSANAFDFGERRGPALTSQRPISSGLMLPITVLFQRAPQVNLESLLFLLMPRLSWVFSEGELVSVAVVKSVRPLAQPSFQCHATVEQGRSAHGPSWELQPRGGKSLIPIAPTRIVNVAASIPHRSEVTTAQFRPSTVH